MMRSKKKAEASAGTNTELMKMYKPDMGNKAPKTFTQADLDRVADDAIRQYQSAQQERGPAAPSGGGKGSSNVDHWKDRVDDLTEKLGLSRPAKGEAGKDLLRDD